MRRRFSSPAGYLIVELTDHFLQKYPKEIQQHTMSYFDLPKRAILEPSGRAFPVHRPHKQPEIQSADMDEQPFQDIVSTAQMHSPHSAGLIQVSIHPFQLLASLPL